MYNLMSSECIYIAVSQHSLSVYSSVNVYKEGVTFCPLLVMQVCIWKFVLNLSHMARQLVMFYLQKASVVCKKKKKNWSHWIETFPHCCVEMEFNGVSNFTILSACSSLHDKWVTFHSQAQDHDLSVKQLFACTITVSVECELWNCLAHEQNVARREEIT